MARNAPSRKPYQYLLGDSRREASRLRAQAKLWDPIAHALFDRVGVAKGWKVLEVGPGEGSLHRELRRRVKGPVDVVERSPTFVLRIQHMSRRDGHGLGHVWSCNLIDARLPAERYDLVFARWVFLFLPDPLAHVRKLVRALKPGGILAIEDYHRETLCLVPRPDDWWEFIEADLAFFGTQGGDASVGSRLPEMYHRAGLEVVGTEVTIKTGRPRSAVWKWITTYFMGVMDRLPSAHPPFTKAKATRLRRQWLAAAKQRTSLMIAPAVLDVVGRKPDR